MRKVLWFAVCFIVGWVLVMAAVGCGNPQPYTPPPVVLDATPALERKTCVDRNGYIVTSRLCEQPFVVSSGTPTPYVWYYGYPGQVHYGWRVWGGDYTPRARYIPSPTPPVRIAPPPPRSYSTPAPTIRDGGRPPTIVTTPRPSYTPPPSSYSAPIIRTTPRVSTPSVSSPRIVTTPRTAPSIRTTPRIR